MAGSRWFAGGTDEVQFRAEWNAALADEFTIAVVAKPASVAAGIQNLMEALNPGAGGNEPLAFGLNGSSLDAYSNTDLATVEIISDSSLVATAGDWQLFALTKGRGTVSPRFHRILLSTGAATHVAPRTRSGHMLMEDVVGGRWVLGKYHNNASDSFRGEIAAAAVWHRALSDSVIASMTSWVRLFHTAPRAAWRLDGSPTFVDETGRNNDQYSISGTSHDTDEPSGFWPVNTTGSSYRSYGSGAYPPASWRPYDSGSVWNTPIDPLVDVVHPSSATLVSTVLGLSGNPSLPVGNLTAGRADTTADYSHPLFFARSDDPEFTLDFAYHGIWGSHPLQGTRLRIPNDAYPAGGDDGHMSIVQPPDGSGQCWEYDLWQVVGKPSGGGTLDCGWGGRLRIEGSGIGASGTAAHFGLAAGTIRASELVAGTIDHALFATVKFGAAESDLSFGYGTTRGTGGEGSFVYPAENGDAYPLPRDPTTVPPMGARFWFDMDPLDIGRLSIPAWKKTILKALNRYGAYFGDTGGPGFAFQFESGTSYTSFGIADPLVTYAADNSLTRYQDHYVFNLSQNVDWARYLKIVIPPTP